VSDGSHHRVALAKLGGEMSVSQQLAAALVELEAEDVAVVDVDAQNHGMKVAQPCGSCTSTPCLCSN
jgi:uncharacterized protein YgbK (DUF1537 family)